MADSKHGVLHLTAGEPERLDGLCPACFLPALFRVPLYSLTVEGVHLAAWWTGCVGCPAAGELEKA